MPASANRLTSRRLNGPMNNGIATTFRPRIVVAMAVAMATVAATGCADPEPTFLVEPSADDVGDYGVAVVERDLRVRVDDTVSTLVYLPTDGPRELADGPFELALLLHGGDVKAHQYAWLARHLARRGFVVAAPEHAFDLAIFSTGNGPAVIDAIDRASDRSGDLLEGRVSDEPAIATGHSLGGVVATKTWLRAPDRVSHLLLLQSIPDSADADDLNERSSAGRVFAIAGERDGRIPPDEIADELRLFDTKIPLAVVEGQNHFQLVDGPEPSRFASDHPATIDESTGRRRLLETVDVFIDDYRGDDTDFADPQHWPSGVEPHDGPPEEL